jgi:hypothetical protein
MYKLQIVLVTVVPFLNLFMLNVLIGDGIVRSGAALRYGSGFNKMNQLLAAQAPDMRHCCKE